ncbi:34470_t:CDS:2, partial [Racocetra persica]
NDSDEEIEEQRDLVRKRKFEIKNYKSKEGFNESSDNSSNKINESILITLENSQQANNSIDERIKVYDVLDDNEIMFDTSSSLNNDNSANIIQQNNEGEQNDINGSNVIEKDQANKTQRLGSSF